MVMRGEVLQKLLVLAHKKLKTVLQEKVKAGRQEERVGTKIENNKQTLSSCL